MGTGTFNTDRFKLSAITIFLKEHLRGITQFSATTTLPIRNYFSKLLSSFEDFDEIVMDSRGTILTWNRSIKEMGGYSETELIGQNLNLLFLPRDRQDKIPEGHLEEAKKNGSTNYKCQLVTKEGSTFMADIKIVAIRSNQDVVGYTLFCKKHATI